MGPSLAIIRVLLLAAQAAAAAETPWKPVLLNFAAETPLQEVEEDEQPLERKLFS